MPQVVLTPHLARFFPDLTDGEIPGRTVAQVIAALDGRWPGLGHYLVDERGRLRPHVNIFVDGQVVRDRARLTDPVADGGTVHILQSLSGG